MNFKLIIKIDNYIFNTGLIQGAYIVGQVSFFISFCSSWDFECQMTCTILLNVVLGPKSKKSMLILETHDKISVNNVVY